MPFFTHRMVDNLASHIRLYTRAMEKAKVANKDGMYLWKAWSFHFKLNARVNYMSLKCKEC